jgi:exonuclease SbcD
MRRLIVDRARWAIVSVNLGSISDETVALRKIEEVIRPAAEKAEGRLLALRVILEGTTNLHRSIKADPRRFSEEVQAAAHHCGEDIWLESLRIETREPPVATSSNSATASIDLAATLDTLTRDLELRDRATNLIAEITAKLPAGSSVGEASPGADLDALFEDARSLALGRATPAPEN